MNQVLLLLALATVSKAGLLEPGLLDPRLRPDSLQGGFHHRPPYDSTIDFYKARYYAKKAYDIATLRNKIFGLGNGFYGYRYGSNFRKPHFGSFPEYLGLKYQSSGLAHPNFYGKSVRFHGPTNYGSSYSQNFASGKGYSYSLSKLQPSPIDYNLPRHFKMNPLSPGYKYSYFVQGPFSKFGTQIPFKGYNTIYGTRYTGFPSQLAQWKSKVPSWYDFPMTNVPGFKGYDTIYGMKYTGSLGPFVQWKSKVPSWYNFPMTNKKVQSWYDFPKTNIPGFKGYDTIYGTRYTGFPNQIPSLTSKVPAWHMFKDFKGYPNVYGHVSSGFPSQNIPSMLDLNYGPLHFDIPNKKETIFDVKFDTVDSGVTHPKGTVLINPNYNPSFHNKGTGYDLNYRAIGPGVISKEGEEFFNENPVPELPVVGFTFPNSGNTEPEKLAIPSGVDFHEAPGHYELNHQV
ncbi:hypothetical protein JTE90_020425 [Oedothorax gibbosus]|uniref:Uncharacterized protein n=1 Tax=Oedothorax gibbosus TaxID=931172 RepID=A0AAV6UG23_9ARAC|nr:hypothetical protein JTE90_020425 [Oedothorax gibbosus]